MANILLIEDHFESIMAVTEVIDQSEHELIGYADTLGKTQQFMTRLIDKEISVDLLILDGNLGDNDLNRKLSYTFPPDVSEQPQKRLFRKPIMPQPRTIEVYPDEFNGRYFGADARMIKRFMELCEIEVPIIGFSGDSMERNGLKVDYDLGKIYHSGQGERLLKAIAAITK